MNITSKSGSYTYQHWFIEITGINYYKYNNYSNEQSAYNMISDLDDYIIEKRKILVDRIYFIIDNQLTSHQSYVIKETLAGKTQKTIAESLGTTQGSINKCLNGNHEYKNNNITRHGGVIRKLKKKCAIDPMVINILNDINNYKRGQEGLPPLNNDKILCVACLKYLPSSSFGPGRNGIRKKKCKSHSK